MTIGSHTLVDKADTMTYAQQAEEELTYLGIGDYIFQNVRENTGEIVQRELTGDAYVAAMAPFAVSTFNQYTE